MIAKTKVCPFLMFQGKAEEAMQFWVSLIPGSEIGPVVKWGPGQQGAEGSVMKGSFTVGRQTVMCTDSPMQHGFTFTPSFSFWVNCESEEEIRRLAGALSEGGSTLMPLNNYGFSRMFTWVSDRFGVSWQLNLA
jgi:predicted 3-demethylubiquinone-9 3-methyltransferase (glyoxalase superfamily)